MLKGCVAAATCVVLAMTAPGCTTQQNQTSPYAQNQSTADAPPIKDLPEVASLRDYIAEGSNDDPFMYPSASPNDPLMIDPLGFAPYWYPVPVYYVYVPVHRHSPPPTSVAAVTPSPRVETRSIVASAVPREPIRPSYFDAVDGGMRGFGFAHTGGGRR